MKRKFESPIAPAFMVCAPGRVIVFGEHGAEYAQSPITAAISLRTYLLVTTFSESQRTVELNFRDVGWNHTWEIDTLPWDLFHHPSKQRFYYSIVDSFDPDLLKAIIPHAEAVSKGLPQKQRRSHVQYATAFLYLFLSLGSPECPGFIYSLRTTIPIGAGLGITTSICECLSAALLLQMRTLAGPHPHQPLKEAELQVERIKRWAFVGELCINGVNNTLSAAAKARPAPVASLTRFPKLPLLIIDTHERQSWATQVEKLTTLKRNIPGMTALILDGVRQLTNSAQDFISSADFVGNGRSAAIEHLGNLIHMDHGFLVSLGASHPQLERIRQLVDHADIGWTKLNGDGVCTITLFRPDVKQEAIKRLEPKLTAEGFGKYETVLGADWVGVLWPAVIRNGTDGKDGIEINEENFEDADSEGLEELVGMEVQGNRRGWKFWT